MNRPSSVAELVEDLERRASESEAMGANAPVSAVLRPVIDDLQRLQSEKPRPRPVLPGDLITVKEAARILSVEVHWIYDNKDRIPFVKRVGTRQLRCSRAGIERYMEILNPS